MDDDDAYHGSIDDALEDTRPDDMYHPARDQEKLEEDNDTPASPASDVPWPRLPADHPLHDTDEEFEDDYGEGEDEATDIAEREIGPDDHPKPLEPED